MQWIALCSRNAYNVVVRDDLIFTCFMGKCPEKLSASQAKTMVNTQGKPTFGAVCVMGKLVFEHCVGLCKSNPGMFRFRILMQQQSPYQTEYVMHNAFKNLPLLKDL